MCNEPYEICFLFFLFSPPLPFFIPVHDFGFVLDKRGGWVLVVLYMHR